MALNNPRPRNEITDEEMREQVKEIQEQALSNILKLTTTPTAAVPQLEDNALGDDDTDLWIRVGNQLLQITPTSRITIT